MRHDRACGRVAALLGVAALSGCAGTLGTLGMGHQPSPTADNNVPRVDRASTSAALLAGYLDVLQRLLQAPPAEQAEILSAAQHDYSVAPTPSHELRYALIVATPGHAGFDVVRAQQLLREVLAQPETLLPSERALALVMLQNVQHERTLVAENQRLQADTERSDREHQAATAAAAARRLQVEQEENARLRRELEDAHAKLDAIVNIERSLSKRKTGTEGSTQ